MTSTPSSARKAVFLDRDGTISVDVGYIRDPMDLKLIPGADRALKRLKERGFLLVVITNQAGVARKLFDEAMILTINLKLDSLLRAKGVAIDGFFYCPHHRDVGEFPYRQDCLCRKPETMTVEVARLKWGISMADSFMVGDKLTDIQLGNNAGLRSILVTTGYGAEEAKKIDSRVKPLYIAPDLTTAAEYIEKTITP